MATWCVQATASESAEVLAAFVAHYISLGSQTIHLYLDHPDDRAEALLAQCAAVNVTVCDAAYWARLGMARPHDQESRQMANANLSYHWCPEDWMLSCDVDEFLVAPISIAEHLDTLPPELHSFTERSGMPVPPPIRELRGN